MGASSPRKRISQGSTFEQQIGYSRAVVDGRWVFVSGTTGFDYSDMTIADGIVEQVEQTLANIDAALIQAGACAADVVRVKYLLPDADDFEACWPALRAYFAEAQPAATMMVLGLADERMKIEIEVTALKPEPVRARPPMVSFVAPSGTGKTTLVESVIGELVARGLKVAAVKHDAHRIELDTEGKDSWRLRQAGAETLLVGQNQLAWMSDDGASPPLEDLVGLLFADADIIVVEGYRSAGLPTLLVERPEVQDPHWHRPAADRIIATVHPSQVHEAVQVVIDHFDLP